VCVCEAEVVDDPRVYCIFFKKKLHNNSSVFLINISIRVSLRII
jgi:hypothetical protein